MLKRRFATHKNIPGTLFAGLLLLAIGATLLTDNPAEEDPGPAPGALQPIGGEQQRSSQPEPATTTRSSSRGSAPSVGGTPSVSPTVEAEPPQTFITGAPRITYIRCLYYLGSQGGRCRYLVEVQNQTDQTITSLELELRVAPEQHPENERVFKSFSQRYQIYWPRESTQMHVDVPSMDIGFYHVRACILGYQWQHPDEGWKHEAEMSCEGRLMYAGPG